MSVAADVLELVRPLADAAGVDLVDVQVKGSGSRQLVRVVVDRKGGVDLDVCERLTQQLSARLDEVDPVPGRYVLEVSSPGVGRPLRDRSAFDRVQGRGVLVHRRAADGRVLQVRGVVAEAGTDAVVLEVDGERVRVPYGEIAKATQSLPW